MMNCFIDSNKFSRKNFPEQPGLSRSSASVTGTLKLLSQQRISEAWSVDIFSTVVGGFGCIEAIGEDFRSDVTDEWATEVLRQTPGVVRLTVFRDETLTNFTDDKDLYEVFTLDLVKKPGKGLGFSIVGRQHDNGIYISDVVSCSKSFRVFRRTYLVSFTAHLDRCFMCS